MASTWPELHAGTNFNYVWDTGTLEWVKETQPGGGGGGGGAVTIADGADVAEGSTADAFWTGVGAGTVISILKRISLLTPGPYTSDTAFSIGENITMAGAVRIDAGPASLASADGARTELQTDANGSLRVNGSAVTQPISATQLPASLGQTTKANSLPVTVASDQDLITAGTPANLAALNAAITATLTGEQSFAFNFSVSVLSTMTLVAEVSDGTQWSFIPFWGFSTSGTGGGGTIGDGRRDTLALSALGVGVRKTAWLSVPPGTTSLRVRVSAYTAGTLSAWLTADWNPLQFASSIAQIGVVANTISPTLIGGVDAGASNVAVTAAFQAGLPSSGATGLIVREVARGQGTMTASMPVVLASDQSSIPVTNTVLTSNLDVALSTRLKAADTLAGVTTLGSITGALPAGTNLLGKVGIDQTTPGTTNKVSIGTDGTVAISGSVAVTGPLTDTQLRASAVPVSAAALPLPSGAATEATLAVGGTNKTLKRAVVSLAATGDVIAAVGGKRLKAYHYALQARTDGVTVQFRDGAAGSFLGLRWGLNAREGASGAGVDAARFLFGTTAGNALQAVISGGTADIEVSYWDDDAS